jgi:catechol 2,3-dioxygenase-like lactoylglutathione lyase family enzyme
MLEANDVQETADFYVDRLGFTLTDSIPNGSGGYGWVNVRRDAVAFMFTERHFHDGEVDEEHPANPLITGSLYVNVADVDGLADELRGRKVVLDFGPTDQPHGMREIGVTDPNGYYLIFGREIAS